MATTTYYLSPISLLIQILSNIGIPLAGGFVATYQPGTTAPQQTFTDSTGTTANANPIPLSAAGRLQSAGGAPVAVWVAAGVAHKMVITDSAGNFILGLDNLTAINDPTALLALLASVSTSTILGGADLIANSMRSYDVIASVRAAKVPALAAGQTLVIDIEGGILIGDGNGGIFYWSATSTAGDDGVLVIKPTSILVGNPGRYLRQANVFGQQGSFQLPVTGCTTAPLVTFRYVQNGGAAAGSVSLSWDATGALAASGTAFGFSGFPNGLQGVTKPAQSPLLAAEDNSANGVACYMTVQNQIGGNAVILTLNNTTGLWTNAGNRQLYAGAFSYNQF